MEFFTKQLQNRNSKEFCILGITQVLTLHVPILIEKKVTVMFRFWYFVSELVTTFYRPCALVVPSKK